MPMTLSKQSVSEIIALLLMGHNHRGVVTILINEVFVSTALDFLRKVAKAKIDGEKISEDWYREVLLDYALPKDYIATNAGINTKTIHNLRQSSTKAIVHEVSLENYERMWKIVDELISMCEEDSPINISLKIQVGEDVTVSLTLNETIIVINALAVKRAAIRGGMWSTAGKRVEKPLMETFCHLFSVPKKHYRIKSKSADKDVSFEREIDFYFVSGDGEEQKCEIKLMGRGNPESADAVIARDSEVFLADKLSDTNKAQLDSRNVAWIELHAEDRFIRFAEMLDKFEIPREDNPDISESAISNAVRAVLKEAGS